MAENWCKEHQQTWFKKGNMKGFAHPILDEEGEKTGKWCNMPKELEDKETSKKTGWKSGASDTSIEAQVAYKGLIELCVANQIDVKGQTMSLALGWALSKIGGNYEVKTSPKTQSDKKVSTDEAGQTPVRPTAEGYPHLKNVGELFSRCLDNGIERVKAMEILGVEVPKDIGDLDQAWEIIKATVS